MCRYVLKYYYLNESRHFIVVIILEVLEVVLRGAGEGGELGAVAELHVGVAEGGEALQQDLLARDLLLARHAAHLAGKVSAKFRGNFHNI